MRRNDTIVKLKMVFDAIVVAVSAIVGLLSNVVVIGVVVPVLMLLTGSLAYAEHKRDRVQQPSDSLKTAIEENVLEGLVEEYEEFHPSSDPPSIRVNVMFRRYRHVPFRGNGKWQLFPFSGNGPRDDVRPWERTLMMEAGHGDYRSSAEHKLEWKEDEGVLSEVFDAEEDEVWADLNPSNPKELRRRYNLTQAQLDRTSSIRSLLCVPIYILDEEHEMSPIGVLNVDCEEPLEDSKFDMEKIRQKVIRRATTIGIVVQ